MYRMTSNLIYKHFAGGFAPPPRSRCWTNGRDGGIAIAQDATTWQALYIVSGFYETPDDLWQALFFVTSLLKGEGYNLYVRADLLPKDTLAIYRQFGFQPIEAGSDWLYLEV